MPVTRWHVPFAWVAGAGGGRLARDVLLTVEAGRITAVAEGEEPPADATRLGGLLLPGFANAHSHAFHRAIRGRTERGGGDFWTWREQMYAVAGVLDPDRYHALARAVYAEMALAGFTSVGEFHYVHHRPDGRPYGAANAMGDALVAAAADAGIRITLLDTCYLRGGFDRPLEPSQRRFGDGTAQAWAQRASRRDDGETVRLGAAIHSVRAVAADAMAVVGDWAAERSAPLHVHVSEQPAENAACLAATGRTPVELLAGTGVLGPRTTAVHATHLTDEDVAHLAASGSVVCLCPTTERSLADGVGPAARLRDAGVPLSIGSDSHAVIDPFEEARAIELDERLVTGRRGVHDPVDLLAAATEGGARSLGWDAGRLEPGRLADFVAVDVGSVRLAGLDHDDPVPSVVFGAAAADVTDVVCGGRRVVADHRHTTVSHVAAELDAAIRAVVAGGSDEERAAAARGAAAAGGVQDG
jgi:formiminoglutamate deiminase